MKTLLLSTAALVGFTSFAAAADLPVRMAPPAPVPVAVPVFTWTGFYVGVHGAWVRPDIEVRVRGVRRSFNFDETGFGGGGQIGYLMQFGNVVAGIEADITATDVGDSRRFRTSLGPFTARGSVRSDMDYFGTVKGRLGYSFASFLPFFQQSMIYVTGGLGYAGMDHRAQVNVFRGGVGIGGARAHSDEKRVGFVVGGGTENAITNNISIKTETVYYNLDDENVRIRGRNVGVRYEHTGWISKVGLNVRF